MDSTLVNRYRQYKVGTTKVVNWLANAARNCRDITNILPSLRDAKNAAKQAKRNKKHAPSSNISASASTSVKVTTAQLLDLAHVVANAALPVPEEILRTIRTVIEGRQFCAESYAAMPDAGEDVAEQNDSHRYFIHVLKEILGILDKPRKGGKPTKQAPKTLTPAVKPAESSTTKLENKFELLQIDEPSSNALGSVPSEDASKVTFELAPTRDEENFAIWCLLQDMRELRHEMRSIWLGYRRGEITFTNASMLTAFGIAVFKMAELEFRAEYPKLGYYPALIEHMGLAAGCIGYEVFICPKSQDKQPPVSDGELSGDEIAELFFPRAWMVLLGFIMTLGRKLGKSNEPDDHASGYLNTHAFGTRLQTLVPEFRAVCRTQGTLPEHMMDDFLQVLHILPNNPNCPPPVWTVAACQIYMDMYDIIGPDREHEILLYQDWLTAERKHLDEFRTFVDSRMGPIGGKPHLVHHSTLTKVLDEDPDPYRLKYHTSQVPGRFGEYDQTLPVYRTFLVMPGQAIGASALNMSHLGIRSCEHGIMLLSAAYVYRAALKLGFISKPWADMEFAIKTQSKKRPFVLDPADGLGSMAKCFGLALGMKPSAFRRGKRAELPSVEYINRNCRGVDVDWPFLMAVHHCGHSVPESTPTSSCPIISTGIKCLERLDKSGPHSERLTGILEQYKKTGKVTPTQLLFGMKENLIADEMELHFDYIGLFYSCFEILEEFNTDYCLDDVGLNGTQVKYGYIFKSVYDMLWDAEDLQKAGKSLDDSQLFHEGKKIEEVMDQDTNLYTKRAEHKIRRLTRPRDLVGLEDDDPLEQQHYEDQQHLVKCFGLPDDKLETPGMFCRSKGEVEARVEMLQLCAEFYGDDSVQASDEKMMKAASKVMSFTMEGQSPEEKGAAIARLIKILRERLQNGTIGPEAKAILRGAVEYTQ